MQLHTTAFYYAQYVKELVRPQGQTQKIPREATPCPAQPLTETAAILFIIMLKNHLSGATGIRTLDPCLAKAVL